MRRNKILFVVLLLLGFCLSRHSQATAAEPLKFSISLNEQEYKVGDSIYIYFTLKNKSKKAVYVNTRFHVNKEDAEPKDREVVLIAKDASGNKLVSDRFYDTKIGLF
ncbi:hypothetical protein ACFL1I_02285 [Candidatus Omnitrophota bacterium]